MYSYLQSNIIQYPDAPVQLMFGGTGPFLGFWCDFDGVEWKSIGFSYSNVWWH